MREPKPTGNLCTSCVPKLRPGPSGVRLRHDFTCELKPGQPIDVKAYATHRTWAPGRWRR